MKPAITTVSATRTHVSIASCFDALSEASLKPFRATVKRPINSFLTTERQIITKAQAFRQMCESAITVYDGTENQYVADWARDALRLLDEREQGRT